MLHRRRAQRCHKPYIARPARGVLQLLCRACLLSQILERTVKNRSISAAVVVQPVETRIAPRLKPSGTAIAASTCECATLPGRAGRARAYRDALQIEGHQGNLGTLAGDRETGGVRQAAGAVPTACSKLAPLLSFPHGRRDP